MENNNNNNKRVSRGRQKVAMVKMANESNLQVTFSKRRSGLFKKASELCTLCGAEMALVVFSPGRKVFSFGHPSVEAVLDRFNNNNHNRSNNVDLVQSGRMTLMNRAAIHHHQSPATTATMQLIEAHRNANVRDLTQQLTHVLGQLEAERKRGDELNRARLARQAQCWWEVPIDRLDVAHLDQLRKSLEELRRTVAHQADRILIIQTTANNNNNNNNSNAAVNANFNTAPFFATATGQGQGRGQGQGLMVPFDTKSNINDGGFGTGSSTSNISVHHPVSVPAVSMQMPIPTPPHGYNNLGYGRGFF